MSVLSSITSVRIETAPARAMARRGVRWVMMGVGFVLIAIGAVAQLTPLPIHFPGLLVIVGGLMLVLRSSYSARRTFIRMQRRHPKVVFPMRRLLRREPEVLPVAWQQVLRTEKAILPRRWRFAGRTRRHVIRIRRKR
jgi:uncharacterized membrane protein